MKGRSEEKAHRIEMNRNTRKLFSGRQKGNASSRDRNFNEIEHDIHDVECIKMSMDRIKVVCRIKTARREEIPAEQAIKK